MSTLLTTLEILAALQAGRMSAATITTRFEISLATARRLIADARSLGAEIEAVRTESGWVYELRNAAEINDRLEVWLELERSQTLCWEP